MARPPTAVWRAALAAAGLVLGAGPGGGCGGSPQPVPGAALAARVEAHLAEPAVRAELKESLGHYGLVFPVSEADLHAFLGPIRVLGVPGNLVPGAPQGLESHGGGLLALLLRHWRPEGRAARLADRFPFGGRGPGVPLAALYASLRHQVFLPVPDRRPDTIAGALPDTAQLARVRHDLRDAGLPWAPRETDAWNALALLAEHEPDPDAAWTNALGQPLRVRLLLDHAGRHYMEGTDTPAEPDDHSELHLVEVLLDAGAAGGPAPEAVQQRFLRAELARREFEPADEALLLAHHAESLGALLADPRVDWSAEEARRARAWLAWVEAERFDALDETPPRVLAHLLRGLRLVQRHAGRLQH